MSLNTLGIIENYGIICPEYIVNFSSFEPLGKQTWDELAVYSAEEKIKKLVSKLDSVIQEIRLVPDFQGKLDTFDLAKKRLRDISAKYDNATWAEFYGIYALSALEHAHSIPSDLRNLTIVLLKSEASSTTVRQWSLLDSVYREEYFAQAILWVMAHTEGSLPAVVFVGRGHLIGLLKALAEAQTSYNVKSL